MLCHEAKKISEGRDISDFRYESKFPDEVTFLNFCARFDWFYTTLPRYEENFKASAQKAVNCFFLLCNLSFGFFYNHKIESRTTRTKY